MHIPHKGALQFCFFKNSFDGHISVCSEWNWKKAKNCTGYILLEETLVQFVCTYLARGRCNSVFSKILLIVISWPVVNGIAQKFYARYILLEEIFIQFVCTYLTRERCSSVFSKIPVIVISLLLVHGNSQNFIWNIRTARDDIDIISVIIPP